MEFGLFSNDRRPDRTLGEAWDEDIREIVAADRLGFHEAWLSEHQTPAELIIAKAAALTSRSRLGAGGRPLRGAGGRRTSLARAPFLFAAPEAWAERRPAQVFGSARCPRPASSDVSLMRPCEDSPRPRWNRIASDSVKRTVTDS